MSTEVVSEYAICDKADCGVNPHAAMPSVIHDGLYSEDAIGDMHDDVVWVDDNELVARDVGDNYGYDQFVPSAPTMPTADHAPSKQSAASANPSEVTRGSANAIKHIQKEEEVPDEANSHVKDNVLMFVFRDTCPHCRACKPAVQELMRSARYGSRIQMVDMAEDTNDWVISMHVTGIPTFFRVRTLSTGKRFFARYTGDRTVSMLAGVIDSIDA